MFRNILILTALFFSISGLTAVAGECIGPGAQGDLKIRQTVDTSEGQSSVIQQSFVDQSNGKNYSILPTKQAVEDAARALQAHFQDRRLQILQVRNRETHELIGHIVVMQSEACGDRYDPPDKNG